jgi:hypothetical protein
MSTNPFNAAAAGLAQGIQPRQIAELLGDVLPIIYRAIVAVTPVKTGRLQRGTTYGLMSATVGFIRNAERYAMPVHEGSRPHVIEAKNKKTLAFMAGGQMRFPRKVNHPGNAANPFFDLGLDRAQPSLSPLLATWGAAVLSAKVGR